MQPTHLLFILSDQHNRNVAGCYGHPLVETPHLDSLAARGTRFTAAYANSPVCVPSRAALATGRHVHQTRYWDNAFPYEGEVPSWGHRLKSAGHRVDSIGKLHFRSQEDDNGFTQEIQPLHVVDGIGDILACLRDDPPSRDFRGGISGAGPGDSTYLRYDASNGDQACRWLADHASDPEPWVLFLSFVCPHPPYIAPEALYRRYPLEQVPLAPQWQPDEWPDHPALDYLRRFFHYDEPFAEEVVRKLTATYLATTTFLDQQIGRVLQALHANGLEETTRILYTSDHGDSLGARGTFGKLTHYDESAAVPLLMAGPDVPVGKVVQTPISLVDCFPTVLEAVGVSPQPEDAHLPGRSLWQIAQEPDHERTVLSEFHAVSSRSAVYMLRDLRHKYIHYVGEQPQLFDMVADPDELHDLAGAPESAPLLQTFASRLRTLLDPEATDALAKADQRAKIEACGGAEAVRRRGAFDNSPVPGEKPAFRVHRH